MESMNKISSKFSLKLKINNLYFTIQNKTADLEFSNDYDYFRKSLIFMVIYDFLSDFSRIELKGFFIMTF